MGALTSRQNARAEEEAENAVNQAYKYPPRSGNYFGSHFIMGGERFDTPQPEAYLFGENADLNFLGSRPTPFPYPPPPASEPTKTLKSLVNIRKETVRFVKATDNATKTHDSTTTNKGTSFNIEFVFDCDVKCAITIYYFCMEEIGASGLAYHPRDSALTSETFHYKKGANQLFSQPSHIFNPGLFSEDDLAYSMERDIYPILIHCVVEEDARQSHSTICVVDHHSDGMYVLRALKQKIFVDGLCYLLQEIYGIENKNIHKSVADDECEDNGSECVICMCDQRDTLILPCRHLCLCSLCAESLRYQANNCPICRAPFRALLQIRAVEKISPAALHLVQAPPPPPPPANPSQDNADIPAGYQPVSLIEALNGPTPIKPHHNSLSETIDNVENSAAEAAEQLNRTTNGKVSPSAGGNGVDEKKAGAKDGKTNAPEFRMSVLLNKEGVDASKHSPMLSGREKNGVRGSFKSQAPIRDGMMKIINEKMPNNITDNEDDSEAEKLSPLLSNNIIAISTNKKQIKMDSMTPEEEQKIVEPMLDDAKNSIKKKKSRQSLTNNEVDPIDGDSDYYTPEDPHTTILSPISPDQLKSLGVAATVVAAKEKENGGGGGIAVVSAPAAAIIKDNIMLPDSPLSGQSQTSRSSGDSYSSSSSTKQLLSSVMSNVDLPTHIVSIIDEDKKGKANSANIVNV